MSKFSKFWKYFRRRKKFWIFWHFWNLEISTPNFFDNYCGLAHVQNLRKIGVEISRFQKCQKIQNFFLRRKYFQNFENFDIDYFEGGVNCLHVYMTLICRWYPQHLKVGLGQRQSPTPVGVSYDIIKGS